MTIRWTLALAAALAVTAQAQTPASRPPDILFITVDDLNDWVGPLLGHPQALTPNMDRLADRGMVFANAHTAAPLCNPARTALMFGLRPSSTGVYGNNEDWRNMEVFDGIPSLPRYFRDAGFRTFGAGKLFHAHTYSPQGFFGLNDLAAWTDFYPYLGRQLPDEVGPPTRPANGNPGYLGFDWSPVVTDDSAMGDGQVVSYIERQYAAAAGPEPRFLAAGIYRPHLPWYVPQKYLDMHPLGDIQLPLVLDDDLDDVPPIARPAALNAGQTHDWVLEEGVWPEAVQGYLASVSFADAMVGRLLDALDASGRADSTIIVMMSDHGFHVGEKHRWRKQTLWEDATHVPLIIVVPGVTTPGSRTNRPVSLLDIYPTLTELAGLGRPGHLEGTSLVPLLENPEAEWDHAAVTTNGYMEHAVRDERYRYIRHSDGSEEVYDHLTDPNEWFNLAGEASGALAGEPSGAEVGRRLAEWLPEVNVASGRGRGGARGAPGAGAPGGTGRGARGGVVVPQ
jgi:arylsulfatase A-like enzyme